LISGSINSTGSFSAFAGRTKPVSGSRSYPASDP
jgi:hypothetical protein